MEFSCTKCGLCCATIGKMVDRAKLMSQSSPVVKEMASFPHKYDINGKCEKLNDDNTCQVYESRPTICNVKATRENFFKEVKEEDFHKLNYDECDRLQQLHQK